MMRQASSAVRTGPSIRQPCSRSTVESDSAIRKLSSTIRTRFPRKEQLVLMRACSAALLRRQAKCVCFSKKCPSWRLECAGWASLGRRCPTAAHPDKLVASVVGATPLTHRWASPYPIQAADAVRADQDQCGCKSSSRARSKREMAGMLKRTALVISLLSEIQRLLDAAEDLGRQAPQLEPAGVVDRRTI